MTLSTTKRVAATSAAALLLVAPGTAFAADCRPFLAGPPEGSSDSFVSMETMAGSASSEISQTSSNAGHATFAYGKIVYRPPFEVKRPGQPPIPRPASWRTVEDPLTTYLVDLKRALAGPPLTRSENIPGFQGVDVQITPGIKAGVRVKFRATGVHYEFEGICSTGGVIHGTTPLMDFLIYIRRGDKIL